MRAGNDVTAQERPPWSRELCGVPGGRIWHIHGDHHYTDSGARKLRFDTLCGKAGKDYWRPGYRNIKPSTCAACIAEWERRHAE